MGGDNDSLIPGEAAFAPEIEEVEKKKSSVKKGPSIFFSYHDGDAASAEKAVALSTRLKNFGKNVIMHKGHSRSTSELDEVVLAAMETACVIIIGVSRPFKNSITCQRIARYALKLQAENKSVAVLYVLLQGDYTLMSIPEKVTGWLAHMLKDAIVYPCWAPAHVKGACSSILGVFSLKQHVLHLNMEFDQWEARAHHFKLILLSSRKKFKLQLRTQLIAEGRIPAIDRISSFSSPPKSRGASRAGRSSPSSKCLSRPSTTSMDGGLDRMDTMSSVILGCGSQDSQIKFSD